MNLQCPFSDIVHILNHQSANPYQYAALGDLDRYLCPNPSLPSTVSCLGGLFLSSGHPLPRLIVIRRFTFRHSRQFVKLSRCPFGNYCTFFTNHSITPLLSFPETIPFQVFHHQSVGITVHRLSVFCLS